MTPAAALVPVAAPAVPAEFTQHAPRQHYSVGVVRLFLRGLLEGAVSQRGVAAMLALFASHLPGLPAPEARPVANTGRMWLLRLGLYELRRPKPHAEDWVWIMDHTIQLGPWKCLIIVAVRLQQWERHRGPLEHEDLALVNLTPMEHATGEEVERQLRATVSQTGVPREVVSDGGTELKRGMELFGKDHSAVAHVQDVKHKGATLLKHRLEADRRWADFVSQSNQTKLRVTQTSLAYLTPPALKTKARYMNLDTLVRWARGALAFLDAPHAVSTDPPDRKALKEKLGWLQGYRKVLDEWSQWLTLVNTAEDYVRHEGFHVQAVRELRERLTPLATRPSGRKLCEDLLEFVSQQSAHAKPDERLIGSSEVLESLIGKYKRMQSTHSQGGMTPMLLSVGAAVARKTGAFIRTALAKIATKDVTGWCRNQFGITIQAQRRLAFEGNRIGIQNNHGPP